jgi:hypothetical protein
MRPSGLSVGGRPSVGGLKLLVYEALSYSCMRPYATPAPARTSFRKSFITSSVTRPDAPFATAAPPPGRDATLPGRLAFAMRQKRKLGSSGLPHLPLLFVKRDLGYAERDLEYGKRSLRSG